MHRETHHGVWEEKRGTYIGAGEDGRRITDGPGNKKPFIYYYSLVILIIMMLNALVFPMVERSIGVPYSEFTIQLDSGNVKDMYMSSSEAQVQLSIKDQQWNVAYRTGPVLGGNLVQHPNTAKSEGKVENYTRETPIEVSPLLSFLMSWVAPILVFVIIGQVMRRMMNRYMGGNNVMTFGKPNAEIYAKSKTGIISVGVVDEGEAKNALRGIVDFLHNPQKYADIGANLPKGTLPVGLPGTGKTLPARAVTGEARVPFFSISGPEFMEMFVGMGVAKVRDLFKQANDKVSCTIFIDRTDTTGKKRGGGGIGGNDERGQTLSQLLTEMDGLDGKKGAVILAATNRLGSLNRAFLRPGRFDRRVPVELSDLKGRETILKVHGQGMKMSDGMDYNATARATAGISGAKLANIVNEAVLRTVRVGRGVVVQADLRESVGTVIAGYQKKDAVTSQGEHKVVTYHEVGHALMAACQTRSAPVQKIAIIPGTSDALGYTMQAKQEERYLMGKEEALNKITTSTGERAVEELIFHSITTGASNDIEQAIRIAHSMATQYGMTDEFDMIATETVNNQYLGGDTSLACAPKAARFIDEQVVRIVKEQHTKTSDILRNNEAGLHEITIHLLEKETVTGEELIEIFNRVQKV